MADRFHFSHQHSFAFCCMFTLSFEGRENNHCVAVIKSRVDMWGKNRLLILCGVGSAKLSTREICHLHLDLRGCKSDGPDILSEKVTLSAWSLQCTNLVHCLEIRFANLCQMLLCTFSFLCAYKCFFLLLKMNIFLWGYRDIHAGVCYCTNMELFFSHRKSIKRCSRVLKMKDNLHIFLSVYGLYPLPHFIVYLLHIMMGYF